MKQWARSLRFLPLWFVLPVNLGVTFVLWLLWGDEIALFATGTDQSAVVKTWILRLSMLPAVLVLSWRVIDRRV